MEITKDLAMDPSGFVVLGDHIPGIIQEIRYCTTYNFVGDRIDGYEHPVALLTAEAARALKAMVRGGFEPFDCEWWHFTLRNEPYPDTYFEFPVSMEYLKRNK